MTDDAYGSMPFAEEHEAEAEAVETSVELAGSAVPDTSLVAGLPHIPDIRVENAEKYGKKAIEWAWDEFTGADDRPVEASAPNIEIEDHEEVSMKWSSVAQDDPPPSPPGDP